MTSNRCRALRVAARAAGRVRGKGPLLRATRKRGGRLRGRRAGLTLIEVILAVSILSLSFAVLLTAAVRCVAVMKAAGNFQEAQWVLGHGEAEHPLLVGEDVEDLAVDLERYDNGFTFEREIGEDEDEDGLYILRTRVTWYGRGHEHVEEVVRYVLHLED